jgi:hypothetical protein
MYIPSSSWAWMDGWGNCLYVVLEEFYMHASSPRVLEGRDGREGASECHTRCVVDGMHTRDGVGLVGGFL